VKPSIEFHSAKLISSKLRHEGAETSRPQLSQTIGARRLVEKP